MNELTQVHEPVKKDLSWQELKEAASLAHKSGLLPQSINTIEKAIVIAMMGRELGLPPMASLTGIYVVNGMPALKAGLMLRLIYERVPGAKITILTPTEKADSECIVEMQRPNGIAQKFKFSLDDAKKAGFLSKPVWQQNTSTMLRWAAIRTGARIVFADALAGIYMEDEISSFKDDVTPPVAIEEPKLVITTVEPPRLTTPANLDDYIVPFGQKYKGKKLNDIPALDIKNYADWLWKDAEKKGQPLNGFAAEFYDNAMLYLDSLRERSKEDNFNQIPDEEKLPFEKQQN